MGELSSNEMKDREEVLKKIIKDLHAGVSVEKLQKEFKKLIVNTSPEEIANVENTLINEGFPPSEIQRLCDVHVQVFEKSLAKVGKPSKIPGHPIYTFMQENSEAKKIIKHLSKIAKKLKKGKANEDDITLFEKEFKGLREIEKHFQRKENQLFPALEAKKFTGPTKVMWGKHDEIRDHFKKTESSLKEKDWNSFSKRFKTLISAIQNMIFLEEKILYPTSARKLTEAEWALIKQGEPEIGYAWITPSNLWDANIAKQRTTDSTSNILIKTEKPESKDGIGLSNGRISAEQIDLILKNLPVDITFVDENDQVRYYSDTKERIFPRSPAIIGRAVQNCHPPKSVHVVEDILKSFREKKKDVAEFWIQMDKKFIYIRYFPLYDEKGEYRGVVEVSQEVSAIRKLQGEKRIMDW